MLKFIKLNYENLQHCIAERGDCVTMLSSEFSTAQKCSVLNL